MYNHILFICIGNICRSPMAEALLNHTLKKSLNQVQVTSAGLAALVGYHAAPFAQEVLLQNKGIDISEHRAKQVTKSLLLEADLILTMSSRQQIEIESKLPPVKGKVHRLGKWEEYDIPDPYQRPKSAFENALILIEQGIQSWIKKLWN